MGEVLELGTCTSLGVQYNNAVPKAVCTDLVPGLLTLWAMEVTLFSAALTFLCLLPTIYEVPERGQLLDENTGSGTQGSGGEGMVQQAYPLA